MNKKGQTSFFLIMIGVVFFLLALALSPVLKEVVSESTATLDCNNSSISDQNKAVCTSLDIQTPTYTWIVLGLAGMLLAGAGARG